MDVLALQVLNGLSHASTLFLMASGLTLIFGVTRIVNFAHGSFYMLGALLCAHTVTHWWPQAAATAWGYAGVMLASALATAALGALVEWALLRRMRGAPELYQLVATFGLTLVLHDLMLAALGPQEVFAPRFPGLRGGLALGDHFFPAWQLLLLVLGPLVWLGLHLLLSRTRWGRRVQAATEDGPMLSALGVSTRPLMLGVVMLGCGLAGLAGALQVPREPAHLQMDVAMVVETFVVVVTGGLGSVGGAFVAAVIIGLIHALGLLWWPEGTLVLVFLTMAAVLIWRPQGLAGARLSPAQREPGQVFARWPASPWPVLLLGLLAWGLVQGQGDYARRLLEDVLVMALLGLSLQLMMALGGLVSFGHAAYFALGAYTAAGLHLALGWPLWAVLPGGLVSSAVLAAGMGVLLARSSGVYLAMLSLALAQAIWAGATQWVGLTGGDNGLIGLQLVDADSRDGVGLALLVMVVVAWTLLWRLSQSSWGAALQAARDAPQRALASGLPVARLRHQVLVLSAALAGLAGAWWAAIKGAVFPSVASVATSVDALLVVLLGGLHQVWGALVGSTLLIAGAAELGRGLDYWRGWLGLLIMLLMVGAPSGLLSALQRWRLRQEGRS